VQLYKNPVIGSSVLFVFVNRRSELVKRPAIVVSVGEDQACSLNVFVDGTRDLEADWQGQVWWRCDVPFDPEDSGLENSWVWAPRRGI
jgi:hypothetical protein